MEFQRPANSVEASQNTVFFSEVALCALNQCMSTPCNKSNHDIQQVVSGKKKTFWSSGNLGATHAKSRCSK